jgi:hypothetical protein
MDAAEYLYKYIEFFFSKEDLETMLPPKSLSYEMWLSSVYDVYFDKKDDPNIFHYNIKFSPPYKKIMIYVDEIKNIKEPMKNKEKIYEIKKKIEDEYKFLYYYQDVYVYAHYFFETMKNNNVFTMNITGGGITLEQFKQKIRDKIKELY